MLESTFKRMGGGRCIFYFMNLVEEPSLLSCLYTEGNLISQLFFFINLF